MSWNASRKSFEKCVRGTKMLIILFAAMVAITAIRIAYKMSWIIGGEDEFLRFCAFVIMGVTLLAALMLSLCTLIHDAWGA